MVIKKKWTKAKYNRDRWLKGWLSINSAVTNVRDIRRSNIAVPQKIVTANFLSEQLQLFTFTHRMDVE